MVDTSRASHFGESGFDILGKLWLSQRRSNLNSDYHIQAGHEPKIIRRRLLDQGPRTIYTKRLSFVLYLLWLCVIVLLTLV